MVSSYMHTTSAGEKPTSDDFVIGPLVYTTSRKLGVPCVSVYCTWYIHDRVSTSRHRRPFTIFSHSRGFEGS